MKEYTFEELGYFCESDCKAIKEIMDGQTYMKFVVSWYNKDPNCVLMISTDYDDEPQNIKNFFIWCVLSEIRGLMQNK